MSKFTNVRDAVITELGNRLVGVLIDAIVRRVNGRRTESGSEGTESILGNPDSSIGAEAGSPREAAGSTGVEHGRSS